MSDQEILMDLNSIHSIVLRCKENLEKDWGDLGSSVITEAKQSLQTCEDQLQALIEAMHA